MSPLKLTARRLLSGGALCAALGGLGVAAAAPATAVPLVWGNAQAWVADGDITTGYSTAVSFGGDNEATATVDELHGPLAEYAEITGASHTVVDEEAAWSSATVESATVRLDVDDLVDLGMIDPPPEDADPPVAPEDAPELEEPRHGAEEDGERGGGEDGSGSDGDTAHGDEEEVPPTQRPTSPPDSGSEVDPDPTPSPTLEERWGPDGEPVDREPGDVDADIPVTPDSRTVPTENNNSSDSGEGGSDDSEHSDESAVEFTLADVTTTASATFDGETEATFTHGDLSAFGTSVGPLDTGDNGQVVEDRVQVLDDQGDLVEEVPVSVRFVVNETTFEDDDAEWDGEGVRTWLTAWVQVGDPEDDTGFAVDFADSWVLGSAHELADQSEQDRQDEGTEEATGPDNHLAMTGSSIAALVTAAVIAVGSGSAATFLARKRTTAMDDHIED